MADKLIVIHDFAGYRRGDQITDPQEVATAVATNPSKVVKVLSAEQPAR
jgi:hypothetical protein